MKFKYTENAPSGKFVLNFRIGCKEAEIMKGLVDHALLHIPKMQDTQDTIIRLKNMQKSFKSDDVTAALKKGDNHHDTRTTV